MSSSPSSSQEFSRLRRKIKSRSLSSYNHEVRLGGDRSSGRDDEARQSDTIRTPSSNRQGEVASRVSSERVGCKICQQLLHIDASAYAWVSKQDHQHMLHQFQAVSDNMSSHKGHHSHSQVSDVISKQHLANHKAVASDRSNWKDTDLEAAKLPHRSQVKGTVKRCTTKSDRHARSTNETSSHLQSSTSRKARDQQNQVSKPNDKFVCYVDPNNPSDSLENSIPRTSRVSTNKHNHRDHHHDAQISDNLEDIEHLWREHIASETIFALPNPQDNTLNNVTANDYNHKSTVTNQSQYHPRPHLRLSSILCHLSAEEKIAHLYGEGFNAIFIAEYLWNRGCRVGDADSVEGESGVYGDKSVYVRHQRWVRSVVDGVVMEGKEKEEGGRGGG